MEFYKDLSTDDLSAIVDGVLHTERWMPIWGFVDKYEISSFGRVKSLERHVCYKNKNGKLVFTQLPTAIMKQYDSNGYLKVDLYADAKRRKVFVHALVAAEFCRNPDELPEVNHIYGDRKCNFFNRLEWVSCANNVQHAYSSLHCKRRGLNKSKNGVEQYTLDGVFVKWWATMKDITNALGYEWSCISRCCRGVSNTSYGFKWKYKL